MANASYHFQGLVYSSDAKRQTSNLKLQTSNVKHPNKPVN